MKQVLYISLCALFIWSCDSGGDETTDDNFDRQAMLINWADNIIIPAYKNYKENVDKLNTEVGSFTSEPNDANLQSLRAQWKLAYLSWQWVSMFEIGQAETLGLQGYTNLYPVDATAVESNIASGGYNLELPSRRDQQGFPALDYLINGIGSSDTEIVSKFTNPASNNPYNTYLQDITNRLVVLTTEVVADWEGNYRDTFVNNDGSSATGAVNKLTNDFIFYFEKHLRAGKIGIPAGVFSGTPDATDAEAYYTDDFSRELYLEALSASKAFFNGQHFNSNESGKGFKSYLDYLQSIKGGEDLAGTINNQFTAIDEISNTLLPNLSEQVLSNNTLMLNTYDALQTNVINFKVDMLQALNIKVDYVDADGD